MKKLLLFALFIMPCTALYAQQTIDTSNIICKYRYACVIDTTTQNGFVDTMTLEVGRNFSKFYNTYNEYCLKEVNKLNKTDVNAASAMMFLASHKRKNKNTEYQVYTNFSEKKFIVTDFILRNGYEYEENIEIPKWEIYNDTMNIEGYCCKKATCNFHGRNYEAWFTTDIPIDAGPWKFNGLPGLIIKVTDDKLNFQFLCTSIKKEHVPITSISNMPKITKITKKELTELQKKYANNVSAFLDNIKSVDENGNLVPLPAHKIPYNPIELEYQ